MQPMAARALQKHLRMIERELERQLKNQARRSGVTSAQCRVLLELAEAGEASLVELSERVGLDTSTVSRTIDGLVGTGHVTRITDPADRRYVRLAITGKEKRKVELIDRCCDQYYVDVLHQVSKDKQAALANSGRQVAEALARKRNEKCCARDAPVLDRRGSKT